MGVQVFIFTLEGCGRCKILKSRFTDENIPFSEIEVTKNQNIWNQVVQQTKAEYLPVVYIQNKGTNSGLAYCPSKDFNTDDEIVAIVKKHMEEKKEG